MKTLRKSIVVASAVLVLLTITPLSTLFASDQELKTVQADEFFSLLESRQSEGRAAILDVRTPGEFSRGNAPGSVNIDFYDSAFSDNLDSLDRDEAYFIYCNSGNRSGKALRTMKNMGFSSVYDLAGGWSRNSSRLLAVEGE